MLHRVALIVCAGMALGCQEAQVGLQPESLDETLLLLIEPPTEDNELGAWLLYDQFGRPRIDLSKRVDLRAADYDRIHLGVPGNEGNEVSVFSIKDPQPEGYRLLMPSRHFLGAPRPNGALQILVWAEDTAGQRLIGLSLQGEVLLDMRLEEKASRFYLSFTSGYVFGQFSGLELPLDDRGLIIDVASQQIIWRGPLRSGAFLHDDAAFLAVVPGERDQLLQIELPTGEVRMLPAPSMQVSAPEQAGLGTYLGVQATAFWGVLFKNYGNVTFGQFLWWLTPDERWIPVGGTPTAYAKETLLGFAQGGQTMVFERSAMSGRSTEARLGIFAFDLASEQLRFLGPSLSWLGRDLFYFRQGAQMRAADLIEASASSEPFGPALDSFFVQSPADRKTPWHYDACAISYLGGFVAICARPDLGLAGAVLPEPPDWYPATGALLYQGARAMATQLPAGQVRIDEKGRMLVLMPSTPELEGQAAIVSLSSDEAHFIETQASRPVFMYAR